MLLVVHLEYVLNAVVFSFLGAFVLFICFWIFERLTPENLWKQILHDRNNALAIVSGAFMIALAIIIASAIHG